MSRIRRRTLSPQFACCQTAADRIRQLFGTPIGWVPEHENLQSRKKSGPTLRASWIGEHRRRDRPDKGRNDRT